MTPDQYPTSHEIARQLLAMPDVTAVITRPVFDSPREMMALPVSVEIGEVQGRRCVFFWPMREQPPVTTHDGDGACNSQQETP